MKQAPTRHAVELALFELVHATVRALPHRAARVTGRWLGDVAYRLLASRRRIALDNLARAFPERDDDERRRIAKGAFRQMTRLATEFLSWGRFDARQLCRRWSLDGWETVTGGDGGRSTIFMTAHLGYWELLAPCLGLYRQRVAALVRPLDNPHLDRRVASRREGSGVRLIHKHGAARALTRALAVGSDLIVLVDQRVHPRHAVEVPFFGRPALTTTLIARLAAKHDCRVVPIFVLPATAGRYRVVARPAIEPGDAVERATERYMAAVEDEVRRRPELWMWMHDRWRLR